MPTAARPNKRLLQGERSRDEILDAASRMMSVRGFDGTSIADIARESGLPNSSIYWHFNSKMGILAAVMERGAERFFASVPTTPPTTDDTPEGYLLRTLRDSGVAFVEHPEFLRLFVLLLLSSDAREVKEIVERVRAHGRTNLHALIQHAFSTVAPERAGAIADELADFAMAGFDGAFLALQATPSVSHERLMEQLAEAVATLGRRLLEA